MAHSLIFPFLV